jgi:hypothetical protein
MLSFDGYVGGAKTDDASKMLASALQDKDHDKTKYGKIIMGNVKGKQQGHRILSEGIAETRVDFDEASNRYLKYDAAYIDLTYFDDDGGYKNTKYVNLPKDAYNLARAFEHEYFGHKVYGEGRPQTKQDGNIYTIGSAEEVVNGFRIQRGLPIVYSYGSINNIRIFGTAYNPDKTPITSGQMKQVIKEAEKGNLTGKSYIISQ